MVDGDAAADRAGVARYAVFGQPIAHSLSPQIHAAFAAQLGIAIDYRAIETGIDTLPDALAAFAAEGGRGANLTLPLKQAALALCASLSTNAQRCGSVNTLARQGGGWRGDSTDGEGLIRDLRTHHDADPRGRRILLIGAGGAARASAFALTAAGAAQLVICNRSPERAYLLADQLGTHIPVTACTLVDLVAQLPFDLIVHATSAGHAGAVPKLPRKVFAAHTLCYDLSYGEAARAFLECAREHGAQRAVDGLGMLIEQAAESFALWHGRRPDTDAVYADLRARQRR